MCLIRFSVNQILSIRNPPLILSILKYLTFGFWLNIDMVDIGLVSHAADILSSNQPKNYFLN